MSICSSNLCYYLAVATKAFFFVLSSLAFLDFLVYYYKISASRFDEFIKNSNKKGKGKKKVQDYSERDSFINIVSSKYMVFAIFAFTPIVFINVAYIILFDNLGTTILNFDVTAKNIEYGYYIATGVLTIGALLGNFKLQ
jgi:hypothetical protein